MTLLHESAATLARIVASDDISAVELVGEAISQMDRLNPELNAVIRRNDDEALAAPHERTPPVERVHAADVDLAKTAP